MTASIGRSHIVDGFEEELVSHLSTTDGEVVRCRGVGVVVGRVGLERRVVAVVLEGGRPEIN